MTPASGLVPTTAVLSALLFMALSFILSRVHPGRVFTYQYELPPALRVGLQGLMLVSLTMALWAGWRARSRRWVPVLVVLTLGVALYEFWYVQV